MESRRGRRPAAYLLEANAPPSQDTATGLDRAERVHDAVVSDLLEMWALPRLGVESGGREGGWICVHDPKEDADDKTGPGLGQNPANHEHNPELARRCLCPSIQVQHCTEQHRRQGQRPRTQHCAWSRESASIYPHGSTSLCVCLQRQGRSLPATGHLLATGLS